MQTLAITIHFENEQKPGTPEHLDQVAKNYFKGKGVRYEYRVITI